MSGAFSRMASVTASTKRSPAAVGGKVGTQVTNIASLAILPLMPAGIEIAEYYRLQSPREAYVTYTQATTDVLEGDTLTVGGADYRVSGVGPWPTDNSFLEIVCQKPNGT